MVTFTRTVGLTHRTPTARLGVYGCVGGEVSAELHIMVSLEDNDVIVWQPNLELYEGTHCFTNDRDGFFQGRARSLKPNYYQAGQWIRTSNSVERTPGDWVRVDYEVHHDAS